MNDGDWPYEENARFVGRIRGDVDLPDVVKHFALVRHFPLDQLGRDLRADDETVRSHVADPENQAELLVPFADDGVSAEHDGFGPLIRRGEFGENEAHHEGLNEASDDALSGHDDHGLGAGRGRLAAAVADRVLSFQ